MAERSVLELRVGVDDEVIVTDCCKVSASWRESHILGKGLTHAHLFNILRLDHLSVFGALIGTSEQLQVECRDIVLFHPDNLAI